MKTYAYHYTDDAGKPALRCPNCERRWTNQGSLHVECIVGEGDLVTFESSLNADGWLNDVDNLVARGNHSETICSYCEHSLVDLPGVTEVQHVDQNNRIELLALAHDLDVGRFVSALSHEERARMLLNLLDALFEGSNEKLKNVLDKWLTWPEPDPD